MLCSLSLLQLALQFASHDSVNETHNNNSNPLTYQDMKRTWSSCPTNQLQHLLQSHQSATTALDRAVQTAAEPNHVQASTETLQQALHKPDEQGGRTLQDAIVLDSNDGGTEKNSSAAEVVSALQAPVLFVSDDTGSTAEKGTAAAAAAASTTTVAVPMRSCVTEYSRNAATAMRHYLDTRTKCQEEETRIRSLQRSLELQRTTIATLQQDQSELLPAQQNGENDDLALTMQLAEIKTTLQNCERVIAQLELQLPVLQRTHQATAQEVAAAREASTRAFAKTKLALQNYRDPVCGPQLPAAAAAGLFLNNRILLNVSHQRELGIDRSLGRGMPRAMGRIRPAGATLENRKALLHNRFSYAATINAHLSYPVYCLRFDRTGRYFISGADDYLVKVFCMGGSVDLKKKEVGWTPLRTLVVRYWCAH